MIVFIRSNFFRKDLKQHSCSRVVTLPYPTNSSFVLNNYALKAIEEMFEPNISYKKAGVIVTSLCLVIIINWVFLKMKIIDTSHL